MRPGGSARNLPDGMSGDDRFSPEVLSRIADGVEAINQNLIDLQELQRLSWEEYRNAKRTRE